MTDHLKSRLWSERRLSKQCVDGTTKQGYDGAHKGEYIITVQMCIYDWTSYLVLNIMNAVLSSLHLAVAAAALVPWAGRQEAGGRVRAESSCWRPARSLWCCCASCTWNVEMDTNTFLRP
jgi:hypothetical protein